MNNIYFFFFQAEDGIRDGTVTGVQTCALPISLDPTKDKRIDGGFYAVSPAPDGSVWGSMLGFPGAVVRLNPGSNPTETALAEYYELPMRNGVPVEGFSPRGM